MVADTCGGISNVDVLQSCLFLQSQISKTAVNPLVTALIGVGAALLTAIATAISSHLLKKTERRNTSQREALTELQDYADELRGLWIAHLDFITRGDDLTEGRNPFPDLEQAKRRGALGTRISRVDSSEVRSAYATWSDYAELYFSGGDQQQSYDEQTLWESAVDGAGDALRQLDGRARL